LLCQEDETELNFKKLPEGFLLKFLTIWNNIKSLILEDNDWPRFLTQTLKRGGRV
jgi:hypothetical protein